MPCVAWDMWRLHGYYPVFPGTGINTLGGHITQTRLQGVPGPAAGSPSSPLNGFLSPFQGKAAAVRSGNCRNRICGALLHDFKANVTVHCNSELTAR